MAKMHSARWYWYCGYNTSARLYAVDWKWVNWKWKWMETESLVGVDFGFAMEMEKHPESLCLDGRVTLEMSEKLEQEPWVWRCARE
jgi:hypothetical protein